MPQPPNNLFPYAEMSELLSRSSYKPAPSEYQSLDAVCRPMDNAATRTLLPAYHNPISPKHHNKYAMGHRSAMNAPLRSRETAMSSLNNNTHKDISQSIIDPHTYYEITSGENEAWDDQSRYFGNMATSEEFVPRPYNPTATLGRPQTGKGNRKKFVKDDSSMHIPQVGDLALHPNTTNAERDKKKDHAGLNNDSKLSTEETNQEAKATGNYTYQAFREGTFV